MPGSQQQKDTQKPKKGQRVPQHLTEQKQSTTPL